MTTIGFCRSTALVAVWTLALTGAARAEDKKAAPAAPAAAAAKPAAPAPVAAKPAAAPAPTAPVAAAPAAPPAALPTAPKELETFMKGFEGSWKCETKFAPGAMGPGSPETAGKSTVKFKKEFGGFSWHGEYALAKSKVMPALAGVIQLGYDPGSGQLTAVSYDSLGSATLGSGPIAGDTVVISEEGYAMGMKVKLRETMTKKGPKEIYHKYEGDMGKGYQLMGEDFCKK